MDGKKSQLRLLSPFFYNSGRHYYLWLNSVLENSKKKMIGLVPWNIISDISEYTILYFTNTNWKTTLFAIQIMFVYKLKIPKFVLNKSFYVSAGSLMNLQEYILEKVKFLIVVFLMKYEKIHG